VAPARVLAIVVNWNGAGVVEPCLEALLASDYPGLAALVVDNGSTDGSVRSIAERFPAVEVEETSANLGYAAGVNVGLRRAEERGVDYALLLNNDVELAPDALAELVRAAAARDRAAFLGPIIYYHDRPDVVWSFGGAVSYWTGNIRHVGLRERDTGQFTKVTAVDYVTGCAVLVSMPAVREIGLMDTAYFMYNEDTDWCVRAREVGYEVVVVPAAKAWHRISASSGGGLTPFKVYHRLRSTYRFMRRHARPYQWIGIVPATFVRALGFVVREAVSGRWGNAAAVARGAVDSARGRRLE
jgi:GT2 family glycosyltransferase